MGLKGFVVGVNHDKDGGGDKFFTIKEESISNKLAGYFVFFTMSRNGYDYRVLGSGNHLFCYRSVEELKCHLYVKHKRDEKECPFFSCKYFCSNPYTFKVFLFHTRFFVLCSLAVC